MSYFYARLDASWLEAEEPSKKIAMYYGVLELEQPIRDVLSISDSVMLARKLIAIRRQRLGDLSWFMKCLNEHIAKRANAEDRCTGAFWEGRFKSQALLDDRALLTCMAYVDLNPIRAKMAETLEASDYTSIQQRIRQTQGIASPLALQAFRDQPGDPGSALPYYLKDYLELVDWTGRAVLPNKRGAIPKHVKKILDRQGFDESAWLSGIRLFCRLMYPMMGSGDAIRRAAGRRGRSWYGGTGDCSAVFDST